jgi:hypothetical protein
MPLFFSLIEEGESEKVPYAARKLPLITGIQWACTIIELFIIAAHKLSLLL